MPFVFSDVKKAMNVANKAKPALKGHCGCSFGICIRESSDSSHKDWYEPNEPELEKDGLPTDHFF
ncbi:hypothetical protein H7K49_23385 [Paenibacillus typhae]|nr:hypothetical protein [Paenibacillus typhae]